MRWLMLVVLLPAGLLAQTGHAGVLQVDVRVPQNVPVGGAVPPHPHRRRRFQRGRSHHRSAVAGTDCRGPPTTRQATDLPRREFA